MISMFARQQLRIRRGAYGQATVLLLTVLAALLSVVFMTICVAHLGGEKVASANAVDAVALSAATWEARGLNLIAALNDGIQQCLRLIRWTCVLWSAAAIAACFGWGLPAFLEYSKWAARVIGNAWKTARRFAEWEKKIRDMIPYLILGEVAALARDLNVTGTLYPFNPKGPHDDPRTLELHVAESTPLTLADAISPISATKRRIAGWKWAHWIVGRIVSIIDSVLLSEVGSDRSPVVMLIPEDDLPERQNVRFAGFRAVSPVPIPFVQSPSTVRFPFVASAEAYGGGAVTMTWRSRFIEWGKKP